MKRSKVHQTTISTAATNMVWKLSVKSKKQIMFRIVLQLSKEEVQEPIPMEYCISWSKSPCSIFLYFRNKKIFLDKSIILEKSTSSQLQETKRKPTVRKMCSKLNPQMPAQPEFWRSLNLLLLRMLPPKGRSEDLQVSRLLLCLMFNQNSREESSLEG